MGGSRRGDLEVGRRGFSLGFGVYRVMAVKERSPPDRAWRCLASPCCWDQPGNRRDSLPCLAGQDFPSFRGFAANAKFQHLEIRKQGESSGGFLLAAGAGGRDKVAPVESRQPSAR